VRTYDNSRQSCLWSAEQEDQNKNIMRYKNEHTHSSRLFIQEDFLVHLAPIEKEQSRNNQEKETKSKQAAVMSVH